MRCSTVLLLVTLICVAPSDAVGQERLSERVLTSVGRDDMGFFIFPRPREEWLRFLLTMIARSARVPIGFEEVAGTPAPYDGNLASIPSSARTILVGLTVGNALDLIVSADPRYRWREQDGVILIRPVETWTDPAHFLDRKLNGFQLGGSATEVARLIYARFGVEIAFGEGGVLGDPPRSEIDLGKRLAIDVPPGTIREALNNVVRTHGGLGWMVHYANATANMRTSCIRFLTFDGRFAGVGAARCQSTAGAYPK